MVELRSGECFGYSDVLKIVGFEYLGDMVVSDEGPLECIKIEHPDQLLDLHDRNTLSYALKDRTENYKMMLQNRFLSLKKRPLKNYWRIKNKFLFKTKG